jgi:hypothetical protein
MPDDALVVLGYTGALGALAAMAAARGNQVWTKSVKETDFFAGQSQDQGPEKAAPSAPAGHSEYPPQGYVPPQQAYSPQSTPSPYMETIPSPQSTPSPYPQAIPV